MIASRVHDRLVRIDAMLIPVQPMAFPVNFPVSRSKTRDFRLSGMLVRSCPRPTITTSGKQGEEKVGPATQPLEKGHRK